MLVAVGSPPPDEEDRFGMTNDRVLRLTAPLDGAFDDFLDAIRESIRFLRSIPSTRTRRTGRT